jgi:hypothetical protein
MRKLMLAAVPLLSCLLWGAEDTDRLNEAAKRYIAAKDPKSKDAKAWEKKFRGRVEQRAEDSRLGGDEAAQSVALDWMTDKADSLKAKEERAMLELCRIFKWLADNGIAIPGTASERMREENNMARLSEWLETEAKPREQGKPVAK